jgi:hypothetical protein
MNSRTSTFNLNLQLLDNLPVQLQVQLMMIIAGGPASTLNSISSLSVVRNIDIRCTSFLYRFDLVGAGQKNDVSGLCRHTKSYC